MVSEMFDTDTPHSVIPSVELPVTPAAVPVKSKGGRPRKHSSSAARVAAHRRGKIQRQVARLEQESKTLGLNEGVTVREPSKVPEPPSQAPPELPVPTGNKTADKVALIAYRKELAAFERLWSDWLDKDRVLHLDWGTSMDGAPTSKSKLHFKDPSTLAEISDAHDLADEGY